ncbi:PREDICTED: uncharacterized protein LOC106748484 [Dinoponera quadriceps]|uniref:Uncharacterized protein LOC106748484 n=1 Tax=Dinoponera quadriceps TaxID=609295 RepID=A0A6P3XVF4_DINQU|nr:PREDICTED: uncharacterized protein LOC106748484 [Dinoponera quadriceps]
MGKCYICWKDHSPRNSRQFHSFPQDAEKREKWFNSIGYVINASKHARICSDHFTENDYYYSSTGRRRLKKTAMPSVFPASFCNIEEDSTANTKNDNQNESVIDIKHEHTMDIQHQSIKDIQQSTFDTRHDSIDSAEATLVKKNDTSKNRKQCSKNDTEKVFVRTGEYNIECMKRTDFVTDQSWMKFLKYVNYNRYLHKLSRIQDSRIQKKIVTMQSIIQKLESKNEK